MTDSVERFPFRRPSRRWAIPLLVFGVREGTAYVELGRDRLVARFGWLTIRTPLSNIEAYRVTGPYRWWAAFGARMSVRYKDFSFATTAERGVCVTFRQPVRLVWRHPALTVTVDDIPAFTAALEARGIRSAHEELASP